MVILSENLKAMSIQNACNFMTKLFECITVMRFIVNCYPVMIKIMVTHV